MSSAPTSSSPTSLPHPATCPSRDGGRPVVLTAPSVPGGSFRALRAALLALALGVSACSSHSTNAPDASVQCSNDWGQWGLNASHWSLTCATGQPPTRALAPQIVFDPFVPKEQQDALTDTGAADLFAHYQSPLLAGDRMYMEVKSGTYNTCDPDGGADQSGCGPRTWNTQIWNESAWQWTDGGTLSPAWTYASGWKPVPWEIAGWEPVFHAAVSGNVVVVPEAGGGIVKVDRFDGGVVANINPFALTGGGADPDVYVVSPITVANDGSVFYDALRLKPDVQGYLVKVDAKNQAKQVTFDALVPDAPAATDACQSTFYGLNPVPAHPWPPGPNATPPEFQCGIQRPALNAAPAIGPDGTVFVVSRAHYNSHYGYVVAVNPADLSTKWTASLRDRLHDGCGVTLPSDATDSSNGYDRQNHCRLGANQGVDPNTNDAPAGLVDDSSSSSPVALPNGGVLYGALTFYNQARGHLMAFDYQGKFTGSYDFGWDVTPALYAHDGTYSIVTKDNRYFTPDGGSGPFLLTQLSHDLKPEWSYANQNRYTCQRASDGGTDCVNDGSHWDGFEWCVNAPAIDKNGTVYANSEDGNLYVVSQGGAEVGHTFLDYSLGAAYTPIALDAQGRIYALNGGTLTVIGGP